MGIFYIDQPILNNPKENTLAQFTDTGEMINLHSCAVLPSITLHNPFNPILPAHTMCGSTATFTVGSTEPFSACWFGFIDTGTRTVTPAVVAFIVSAL